MSTKIKYTDEPLGEIKIVRDFLPKPLNQTNETIDGETTKSCCG